MRRRIIVSLAALGLAATWAWSLSGCDLIRSASNDKMLAATVMATPPYDFCNLVLGELTDGGIPISLDAGWLSDAGITLPDGGTAVCQVGSKMMAEVFYGHSKDGISGAKVTLTVGDNPPIDLPEKGDKPGVYGLETDLAYQPSTEYRVVVEEGGQEYSASVTAPPQEIIDQFHDHPVPLVIPPGTEMRFTRRNIDTMAFANVAGFGLAGIDTQPSYSTLPKDALGWIDVALNPDSYKLRFIDIPGSALKDPNRYYLVAVTGVARGKVSSNLFTTSTFIVGVSDIGLLKTE